MIVSNGVIAGSPENPGCLELNSVPDSVCNLVLDIRKKDSFILHFEESKSLYVKYNSKKNCWDFFNSSSDFDYLFSI